MKKIKEYKPLPIHSAFRLLQSQKPISLAIFTSILILVQSYIITPKEDHEDHEAADSCERI